MWEHTASHHGGVMGPNDGVDDYQLRVQGVFKKPLHHQVDDGVRLGQIDAFSIVLEDADGLF